MLVNLDLDATLVADTMDPPKVRDLIATQLMYLVGELNGDNSVGRHPKAFFSVTTFGATDGRPGSWTFTYHATLPVAWGAGTPPATYAVTLPLRVGTQDRASFAEKYAATCTAPEGGVTGAADAGRMFLFYRPQRAGCALLPEDVVRSTATFTASTESSVAKYPEYHRVWEDDALNVVAVFGRELDDVGTAGTVDEGVVAYQQFLAKAFARLGQIAQQPSQAMVDGGVRLSGDLSSGRKVVIEAMLAPAHLVANRTSFDDWYDARTPKADLVIYSGHAGLGENARTLTAKGVFSQERYVVVAVNGCDTFAYLDDSFIDRLGGTKHVDVVSNVLGEYFHSNDETSLELVDAFITALDTPKTYIEILRSIDATQIAVVSGEEDNEFVPGMIPKPKSMPADTKAPAPSDAAPGRPPAATASVARRQSSGCAMAESTNGSGLPFAALVAASAIAIARRQRRRSGSMHATRRADSSTRAPTWARSVVSFQSFASGHVPFDT